jgi:hypothetical protein
MVVMIDTATISVRIPAGRGPHGILVPGFSDGIKIDGVWGSVVVKALRY